MKNFFIVKNWNKSLMYPDSRLRKYLSMFFNTNDYSIKKVIEQNMPYKIILDNIFKNLFCFKFGKFKIYLITIENCYTTN